eukprot:GHVR01040926.1.p1 GENE.GHVR01040926.1~~GHVR01040926.1.p1  ORF type:complete len:134 (+),score=2.57 GHVR01040926.1:176-577(+)
MSLYEHCRLCLTILTFLFLADLDVKSSNPVNSLSNPSNIFVKKEFAFPWCPGNVSLVFLHCVFPFRPSSPYASYVFFFSLSESISYASDTSLNFFSATSLFSLFLFGCHLSASFLYYFLISTSDAFFETPRTE